MSPERFPLTPVDFARSELFERTFKEGMDLVEEAAAYLEGPGRQAARDLTRSGALAYAGESMRLTTRLMQIASWLLVHRAVREGELSDTEAREERYRLKPSETERPRPLEGREELPTVLTDLLVRLDRLYERVSRLDERMFNPAAPAGEPNPVGRQIARLEDALKDLSWRKGERE